MHVLSMSFLLFTVLYSSFGRPMWVLKWLISLPKPCRALFRLNSVKKQIAWGCESCLTWLGLLALLSLINIKWKRRYRMYFQNIIFSRNATYLYLSWFGWGEKHKERIALNMSLILFIENINFQSMTCSRVFVVVCKINIIQTKNS